LDFAQSDPLLRAQRRGLVLLRLRRRVARLLHRLESSRGAFLAFPFSILRRDPFYQSIRDLASEAQMGNALIVGAGVGKPCTEAFLAGALAKEDPPAIFCLAKSDRWGAKLRQSMAGHPSVQWQPSRRLCTGLTLDDWVAKVMKNNQIAGFDAVVVDGAFGASLNPQRQGIPAWLAKANWVFLDGINLEPNWSRHQWLLKQEGMHLLQMDAGLRTGYSIFVRAHQCVALTRS
jgi:hypothetical protein